MLENAHTNRHIQVSERQTHARMLSVLKSDIAEELLSEVARYVQSSNRHAQVVGTQGLDHASPANANAKSSHEKQHAHNMSPKFVAGEPVMHCPDEQLSVH